MGEAPDRVHLVETEADVARLPLDTDAEVAYVTQTTLSVDDTRLITDALRRCFPAIQCPKKDDICYATQNRQDAVTRLADKCDLVLVVDHINLMGDNPLLGSNDFVDLTEAYNIGLRNLTQETADKLGIALQSGVYVGCSGPSYETPAEIRAMRCMGGDLVGMSTVPEVIMANSLGMKVLGLSVITNMAAGMSAKPLSHQDVIDTSKKASPKFSALVKGVIELLQ